MFAANSWLAGNVSSCLHRKRTSAMLCPTHPRRVVLGKLRMLAYGNCCTDRAKPHQASLHFNQHVYHGGVTVFAGACCAGVTNGWGMNHAVMRRQSMPAALLPGYVLLACGARARDGPFDGSPLV